MIFLIPRPAKERKRLFIGSLFRRDYLVVSIATLLYQSHIVGNSLSISPDAMSSEISLGDLPSTWHPTEKAVPRISLTVPVSSLARDLFSPLMMRAMLMISSRGMLLVCLMFFSFLRSLGGSLRARMTREEAEGTTETAA